MAWTAWLTYPSSELLSCPDQNLTRACLTRRRPDQVSWRYWQMRKPRIQSIKASSRPPRHASATSQSLKPSAASTTRNNNTHIHLVKPVCQITLKSVTNDSTRGLVCWYNWYFAEIRLYSQSQCQRIPVHSCSKLLFPGTSFIMNRFSSIPKKIIQLVLTRNYHPVKDTKHISQPGKKYSNYRITPRQLVAYIWLPAWVLSANVVVYDSFIYNPSCTVTSADVR